MFRRDGTLKYAFHRLLQLFVVVAIFCLFNTIGYYFVVEGTVSVFYPATAIDVLACLHFGWIGALGVFIGTILTPWNPNDSLTNLAIVGALNAVEGLVPWMVFRFRRNLHSDLRDFRSFVAFLFFGAIVNSALFAILGNVLLIAGPGNPLNIRQIFTWWISDFSGVLLIATPILAFAGSARIPLTGGAPRLAQRTLVNAMEITAAIVLLGWVATTSLRSYLLDSFENDIYAEQKRRAAISEGVTEMQRQVISSAAVIAHDPQRRAIVRQRLVPVLDALVRESPRDGDLPARVKNVQSAALRWVDAPTEDTLLAMQAAVLATRSELDVLNRVHAEQFAARRARINTVALVMDLLLFATFGLAFLDLITGISRPLQTMHRVLAALRSGAAAEMSEVPSRFVELQTLSQTIEETSRELAQREADLQVQTLRAIEASRHKSDFLAKMSHELRTPLNSIVGFSELLIERDESLESVKRKAFLQNIWRSGSNLLRLINDLLDLAKVEAGKMTFDYTDIDIRLVVQNSVASTAPLFAKKSQRVEVELGEQPVIARVDPGRIEQVLLNLLSNANKFTGAGGNIRVAVRANNTHCDVTVTDNGVGISAADQQRVFEEFEQAQLSGRLSEGTGLGLSLARRFVEAQGGSLTVESEVGAGSTFRITLPRINANRPMTTISPST